MNIVQNMMTSIEVDIAKMILSGRISEKNVTSTLRPKQTLVGVLATAYPLSRWSNAGTAGRNRAMMTVVMWTYLSFSSTLNLRW